MQCQNKLVEFKGVWSMRHKSMYIKEEHNKVVPAVKTGQYILQFKIWIGQK